MDTISSLKENAIDTITYGLSTPERRASGGCKEGHDAFGVLPYLLPENTFFLVSKFLTILSGVKRMVPRSNRMFDKYKKPSQQREWRFANKTVAKAVTTDQWKQQVWLEMSVTN